MSRAFRFITRSIQNHTNLSKALEQSLYHIRSAKAFNKFLNCLFDAAMEDERYVVLFDMLYQRYPHRTDLPMAKAIVIMLDKPKAAIQILSETLVVLHQKKHSHRDVAECYILIAELFAKLNNPLQSIAACKLALSHYIPDEDAQGFYNRIYHTRARQYLKLNQPIPALLDTLRIASYSSHSPMHKELLDQIKTFNHS